GGGHEPLPLRRFPSPPGRAFAVEPRRAATPLGLEPLRRFSLSFCHAQLLASLGAIGKCAPRRLPPPAALADMVQSRRLRFLARLGGASEEELEVRASGDRCG